LSVDSPVGKVTIRAEDHQVMLPMFMGVTTKMEGQQVLVASDIITISAEDSMPSLEEIRKARQL
jgi:branched-chain amino acid transport system substrate-binding protein